MHLIVSELNAERTDGLPGAAFRAHPLALALDAFAWEALQQESAALGVPVDELAVFAILYYLADLDSGRVARRIPRSDRTSAEETTLQQAVTPIDIVTRASRLRRAVRGSPQPPARRRG